VAARFDLGCFGELSVLRAGVRKSGTRKAKEMEGKKRG